MASKNMVMFVDNSRDVKVLVRVNATNHATNSYILSDFHDGIPGSTLMEAALSRPNAWTGQ